MTEVNQFLEIFEELEKALYSIKHNPQERKGNANTWIIDDIVSKGIFKMDSENAQDSLNTYITRIDTLINELPDILEKQKIILPDYNPFTESANKDISTIKNEIRLARESELILYKEQLTSLSVEINERFENLGDENFSNAGFKIKLNMTNEEIACLFCLLYEEKKIIHKKANGDDLTKKELANFIYKNFSSKTKDDISIKNIENNLSRSNPSSPKISELLSMLKKAIDKW